MSYTLRPYQAEAVEVAVRFLKDEHRQYNGIEMLPTGSGKSLVIANIAARLGAPTIIFQPSKEILEQNIMKYMSYGYTATIYSASVGIKAISDVTFSTIGSVIRKPEILKDFRYIIIDECHAVNSKAGMYSDLLKALDGVKVLGLTATPYRLVTDGFGGSILKFLTRTRPRVFTDLIYYVQNEALFDQGYLAKLKYFTVGQKFDRSKLQLNSTGADYTDKSVRKYYQMSNFPERVAGYLERLLDRRENALVFTRFVEESEYIAKAVPGVAIVSADTPKRERQDILGKFKEGEIRAVCNVGIIALGFDFPELETVVLARPTMSLALYYQQIGRAIRPHPEKAWAEVHDLCNNYSLFGPIEKLKLVDGGNGKWFVAGEGGKQLTNVYYGERYVPDRQKHLSFGGRK